MLWSLHLTPTPSIHCAKAREPGDVGWGPQPRTSCSLSLPSSSAQVALWCIFIEPKSLHECYLETYPHVTFPEVWVVNFLCSRPLAIWPTFRDGPQTTQMIPMTNAPSKKLGPGCPLLLPFRRALQLCLPRDASVQRIQPKAFSKDQPWKTWIRWKLSHNPRTPPYLNPEKVNNTQLSLKYSCWVIGPLWKKAQENVADSETVSLCQLGRKRTSSGISLKHLQATWERIGTRTHQEMQTTHVETDRNGTVLFVPLSTHRVHLSFILTRSFICPGINLLTWYRAPE